MRGQAKGVSRPALVAIIVCSIAAGITMDRVAFAQQSGGMKRTILTRTDDPGTSTYEAVMGVSEIPAGASSGMHRHPGVELAYVVEGTVVVDHEGQPPTTLHAGEAIVNAGPHNAKNTGTGTAKILAVYVVEKGKPLAEPVKP